jgi:LacI family transcriptional regulator
VHGKPVTVKDIAQQCGVSVMTVSWALRGDRSHVGEETMARVVLAAEALGYDRHRTHAARRLRYTGTSHDQAPLNHLIALTFSWHYGDSPYFTRILKGVGDVLHEEGFALLTDWALPRTADPSTFPTIFARGEVDGVLTIEGCLNEETVGALRAHPGFGTRPIVSLFNPQAGGSAVLVDDYRGGCLLAEHLLTLGHRFFAYSAVSGWSHEERQRGYRDTLQAWGVDPADHLRGFHFDNASPADAARALRDVCAWSTPPTALLAGNDHLALRLATACEGLGVRIPDDISLVGFDDTHILPDGAGGNLLTTVRFCQDEAGRLAAAELIRQLTQRATDTRTVTLPVELVMRGSTRAIGRA